MEIIKKNIYGILVCLVIAIPSWLLGKQFPVIGGAVISCRYDYYYVLERKR